MLLETSTPISNSDVARFSWNGLRRFANVEITTEKILELHDPPKSQRANCRKQATQIRQCLQQAEQYFSAASTVGLATRPVLLYYGTLSFALAEILLKQDGQSSLDRARGQHAHHGLNFRKDGNPAAISELRESAHTLRAVPLARSEERFGTFELWHRTQRDFPTLGEFTIHDENGGTTTSKRILAKPSDCRAQLLPQDGLSLLDCFRSVPSLQSTLLLSGIPSSFARGGVSVSVDKRNNRSTFTGIIHPDRSDKISKVMEGFKFSPRLVDCIDVIEMPSGAIFRVTHDSDLADPKFEMPASAQYRGEEAYFFSSDRILNEFGNLYVSLFMLGNYARYFPDEWIRDIESSSELSIISEELMDFASRRIPLLMLCELTRNFYYHEG